MNRWIAAIALLFAVWTGRQEPITTVTGLQGVNCEYEYNGTRFWVAFISGPCPTQINIR